MGEGAKGSRDVFHLVVRLYEFQQSSMLRMRYLFGLT